MGNINDLNNLYEVRNNNLLNVIRNVHSIVADTPEMLKLLFTEDLLDICILDVLEKIKMHYEKVYSCSIVTYFSESNENARIEVLKLSLKSLLHYYQMYNDYREVIDYKPDLAFQAVLACVEKCLDENNLLDMENKNVKKM